MEWLGLTTATAPWFFVSLLSGLLAITGVVSGAIVGYRSVKASDERRNRFELERLSLTNARGDKQRWDSRLGELSTDFIAIDAAITSARANPLTYEDPNELQADIKATWGDSHWGQLTRDEQERWDGSSAKLEAIVAHHKDMANRVAELGTALSKLQVFAPPAVGLAAYKLWETVVELGEAPDDEGARQAHGVARSELIAVVQKKIGIGATGFSE